MLIKQRETFFLTAFCFAASYLIACICPCFLVRGHSLLVRGSLQSWGLRPSAGISQELVGGGGFGFGTDSVTSLCVLEATPSVVHCIAAANTSRFLSQFCSLVLNKNCSLEIEGIPNDTLKSCSSPEQTKK